MRLWRDYSTLDSSWWADIMALLILTETKYDETTTTEKT